MDKKEIKKFMKIIKRNFISLISLLLSQDYHE